MAQINYTDGTTETLSTQDAAVALRFDMRTTGEIAAVSQDVIDQALAFVDEDSSPDWSADEERRALHAFDTIG